MKASKPIVLLLVVFVVASLYLSIEKRGRQSHTSKPMDIVKVILRKPMALDQKTISMTRDPVEYRLQIPLYYFIDRPGSKDASFVALWTIYPSFEGLVPEHLDEFYNKVSPNKSIRFALFPVHASYRDEASARLNMGLRRSINGEPAILLTKAAEKPDDFTEYEFVGHSEDKNPYANKKAYTWNGQAGFVYLECSFTNFCRAHKTWKKSLIVDYGFFGSEIPDFRRLDRGLDELIESFHPVQIAQP
jgi:hypothetical protein